MTDRIIEYYKNRIVMFEQEIREKKNAIAHMHKKLAELENPTAIAEAEKQGAGSESSAPSFKI